MKDENRPQDAHAKARHGASARGFLRQRARLTWTSGRLLEATNEMGPWTTNTAPGPTLIVTPVPTVPQQYHRVQTP